MIRPIELEIERFRGWRGSQSFSLKRPITLLVGDNGSGKSSVLNAIEWCLFGNEVEKKGCGIDERNGWEARNREADSGPVRVALSFDLDGVEHRLERARPEGSKKDDLLFETRGGDQLRGNDARERLAEMGFPDWQTYRRAHCQHQETARQRLLADADRTEALALLLGLGDEMEVVESLKVTKVGDEIGKAVSSIEVELEREIERPQREVREVEGRLLSRGVERERLGAALIRETAAGTISRAVELGRLLEVDPRAPDPEDLDEVISWAGEWPAVARRGDALEEKNKKLRRTKATVDEALAEAEPAKKKLLEAEKTVRDAIESGGGSEARAGRLERARRALGDAEKALREADELASLFEQAIGVMRERSTPATCPVCGSEVEGLEGGLVEKIESHSSASRDALDASRVEAQKEVEKARRAVERLEALERELAGSKERWEKLRHRLEEILEEDCRETGREPVALARRMSEALGLESIEIQKSLDRRDDSLSRHADDLELMRVLRSWDDARRRAEDRVDLTETDEWEDFQRTLDDAAGLETDLDALAGMALELQERISEARVEEVNCSLARHAGTISGGRFPGGIEVLTSRKRKKLFFDVVGSGEKEILSVLNQGELNALSIAILLSQAEAVARRGDISLVVLDDPGQSLDAVHQEGLADALGGISESCRLLCSATASPFVERMRGYVAEPRTFYRLARNEAGGVEVLEVEKP